MSYVDQFLVAAAELGVDGPLAQTRELRARADAFNHSLNERRTACEREHAVIVEQLANNGDLLDVKIIPAEAARLTEWAYGSAASELLVKAVALCRDQADRAAVKAAPAVFELLQQRCAAVVAESVKLTARIPADVDSPEKALRAGADAINAWNGLSALLDDWVRAHRLARLLRAAGWVDGPPNGSERAHRPTWFTLFRHSERLPKGWAGQPEVLKLGMAAAAGAEPGLWPWAEAVARQRAVDRRYGMVDDRPTETLVTWKAGNPGEEHQAAAQIEHVTSRPLQAPAPPARASGVS